MFPFGFNWLRLFLGFFVFFIYLFFLKKQKEQFPYLSFSLVSFLKTKKNLRERLQKLPLILFNLSLSFFLIAWADPYLLKSPDEKQVKLLKMKWEGLEEALKTPREGRGIYILLDRSGSMRDRLYPKGPFKYQAMKKLTKEFIEKRPNDLIGLITFARVPFVLSPMTLDHHFLEKKLKTLFPVKDPSDDGTALGYAIYQTVKMIDSYEQFAKENEEYTVKTKAIVILTDGFQHPHEKDKKHILRAMSLDEASEYAKQRGIRLYIVNINPEFKTKELKLLKNVLKRVCEKTKGKLILSNHLDEINRSLSVITPSKIPFQGDFSLNIPEKIRKKYYFLFIQAGFVFLGLSIFLNMTYFRKLP